MALGFAAPLNQSVEISPSNVLKPREGTDLEVFFVVGLDYFVVGHVIRMHCACIVIVVNFLFSQLHRRDGLPCVSALGAHTCRILQT